MSICSITVYSLIETYLEMGWIKLTEVFTHNLTAKEKDVIPGVDEQLLIMLGGIRKYLVSRIFNCCKHKNVRYFAFGSENITSDYDLTLVGKNAPQVVWKMFLMFLKQYNNILPHAFDTNVYCSGIYSPTGALQIPQRTDISRDIFVLSPHNENDVSIQMQFALLKLHQSGYDISKHPMFRPYKENVLNLISKIQKQFKVKRSIQYKKYTDHKYDAKTIDIITKYYLSVLYAKKINKILYDSGETNSLIYYACMSQYFAIESYYTPATVNVVVMSLQGKHKIHIQKEEYIVSTIENLADFRIHLQQEKKLTKDVLLKYSKYVHRILYSLGKATRDRDIQQQTRKIKNEIIPLRQTGSTQNMNVQLLLYKPKMTLHKYITHVTQYCLLKLN